MPVKLLLTKKQIQLLKLVAARNTSKTVSKLSEMMVKRDPTGAGTSEGAVRSALQRLEVKGCVRANSFETPYTWGITSRGLDAIGK